MALIKLCVRNTRYIKYKNTFTPWTHISIPEFYAGKSILVTGCTGFLGQGLIEKLLRSCPEIGNIYVPIKPNKYGNTDQRYEQLLRYRVFDEVRKINPKFGDKIVPFNGDITLENIGMKPEIAVRLTEEVRVIFHCAAHIKLKPPLRESVEGNVVGSKNVFEFGRKCNNLCAYVHVSSTFANIDLAYNEEKIYPASKNPSEIIDLVRSKSDAYLSRNERQIMAPSPLVYVFCKKVAENIFTEDNYDAPTAIFRSCLISPAMLEPFPGWNHGYAGFCGVMHGVKKGYIRHLAGNPNHHMEILPVDLVVNSLISVGWYLGSGRYTEKHPLVLNVHSSADNPVTLSDLEKAVNEKREEGGNISLKIIPNRYLQFLILTTFYMLPLAFLDIGAFLSGKRPINLATFTRLRKGLSYIERSNFITYGKEFKNAKEIHSQLADSDKKDFPFDVKGVDWNGYLRQWIDSLKGKND